MASRQWIRALIAATPFLMALVPAHSQTTTCKTSNCVNGSTAGPVLPAECMTKVGAQPIAKPRIFVINMDSGLLRFVPANPRLEGHNSAVADQDQKDYQCIEWHKTGSTVVPWHSATDNDAGNTCLTATACTSTNTYPNPCDFETGNINGGAGSIEWSSCHYKDLASTDSPLPHAFHYICRLHNANGMNGTLTIEPPIDLKAAKSGTSVALTWTGGSGATGGPWDVFKDSTVGTAQKMQSPARLGPTTGVTTQSFTDTGCSPTAGNMCSYLVRECNKDANTGNNCIN